MSTTAEDRQVRHRLAVLRHAEEMTGNVAMTCRYYGITRQSFYVWSAATTSWAKKASKIAPGGPRPGPARPDVVGKIVYLRQNYHFGPAKIAMYLKRYHDVDISHSACGASSSVWT